MTETVVCSAAEDRLPNCGHAGSSSHDLHPLQSVWRNLALGEHLGHEPFEARKAGLQEKLPLLARHRKPAILVWDQAVKVQLRGVDGGEQLFKLLAGFAEAEIELRAAARVCAVLLDQLFLHSLAEGSVEDSAPDLEAAALR